MYSGAQKTLMMRADLSWPEGRYICSWGLGGAECGNAVFI